VILPDDVIAGAEPCLKQMVEGYSRAGEGASILAAMEVPREQIKSYGALVVAGEQGRLVRASGLVEKPAPEEAPSNLAVIGRYILSPRVMQHLSKMKEGAGGEIQLTDAIADEAAAGAPVFGYRFEGRRYDCGNKLGFLEATVAFALERSEMAGDFAAYLKDTVRGL
jgi:UTP--glucose-1-phosphate uridylyltransferase